MDCYGVLREYRGCMRKSTMMLATVKAMTQANSVRTPGGYYLDIAAKATSRKAIHALVLQTLNVD